MADETQAGETPATEQPAETPPAMDAAALQAELEKVQKALKEANRESASRRKRLEELELAEKTRKDAELSEMERLTAQLKDATDRAARLERERQQADIAARLGLPAALATRIQGATPEEMEADAKSMLEALPKPPPPAPKSPGVLNPGSNGSTAETDAQRRARIYGTQVDIFDPKWAAQSGGGIHWNDKGE